MCLEFICIVINHCRSLSGKTVLLRLKLQMIPMKLKAYSLHIFLCISSTFIVLIKIGPHCFHQLMVLRIVDNMEILGENKKVVFQDLHDKLEQLFRIIHL